MNHLRGNSVTDVAEILPFCTLGRLVGIISDVHQTLGVRAILFLRYHLVE